MKRLEKQSLLLKTLNILVIPLLLYLKDQVKYAKQLTAQRNMGGFMKGILIKRLESSFFAFSKTLGRFIESYEKFIEMVKTGKVYISKKVNVYDLLDDGNINKLLYYIEQEDVMAFETSDFQPKLLKDLESDLAELKYLRDLWSMIKVDPKLAMFKHELQNNNHIYGHKIIVFTESTETAEYLYNNLTDIYGKKVVCFSGQSSRTLKVEIEDSFNPKNKAKRK